MKIFLLPTIVILGMSGLLKAEESGKHLFILSGQSNMEGAGIIGGCCGISPDHLHEVKTRLIG